MTTVVKIFLNLDDAQAASLQPRAADPTSLVTDLVAHPRTLRWATERETFAAVEWLQQAATDLNDTAIRDGLDATRLELAAEWRWPDTPLVAIRLDGEPVTVADYLPASASVHCREAPHRVRGGSRGLVT